MDYASITHHPSPITHQRHSPVQIGHFAMSGARHILDAFNHLTTN
jgi:hypothetical protein